jgi:CheY-like chemotaxis protein
MIMEKEKILIVEDEIIIARDTESRLKKMGYTVTGIADSRDGTVNAIEKNRPDLVLMDIMIKGQVDGIETAIEIKKRFNIPVVFQTAYADEITLGRARVSDFYGYLVKPIKGDEFKIAVENALYRAAGEESIRISAEFFKSILETLSLGVIVADNDGYIVYMNNNARSYLEVGEEATGIGIDEIFKKTGEKVSASEPAAGGVLAGYLNKSARLSLKSGKIIDVIYSMSSIQGQNSPAGMALFFAPAMSPPA